MGCRKAARVAKMEHRPTGRTTVAEIVERA
jgi:hypothetical protein